MDGSSGSFSSLSSEAKDASTHESVPQETDSGSEKLPENSEKAKNIAAACQKKDLGALIGLATSPDGLVSDELRKVAWPLLLGTNGADPDTQPSWSSLPPHRDEEQVQRDVDRSFVYYPNVQSEEQLSRKKNELFNVIVEVLRRNPQLCYFQGYHDIVQVIMLVLGSKKAVAAVTHLSLLRIRDFMLPTLSAAVIHLRLIPAIIYRADPLLYKHLKNTLNQPYFALTSTLTLYAHDIQGYGQIARLFDFLLAREPVISLYLFVAIILSQKHKLLEIAPDEYDMMHFTLSKLPAPFDLEQYILDTMALYAQHPPASLPFSAWHAVSSYSVLKTATDPQEIPKQDLEYAREMFAKHSAQVLRMESWQKLKKRVRRTGWRYRRPAGAIGLAVTVAVLSWWLARSQRGILSNPWLSEFLNRLYLWR